jgi:hypothetical protein
MATKLDYARGGLLLASYLIGMFEIRRQRIALKVDHVHASSHGTLGSFPPFEQKNTWPCVQRGGIDEAASKYMKSRCYIIPESDKQRTCRRRTKALSELVKGARRGQLQGLLTAHSEHVWVKAL